MLLISSKEVFLGVPRGKGFLISKVLFNVGFFFFFSFSFFNV